MEDARQPALGGAKLTVEIRQARDLIAKDRNLMGRRTTSDPYVQAYVGDVKVGITKSIPKNCSPVWNETLTLDVGADVARSFGKQNLELRIFDFDSNSSDDPMGVVMVPIVGGPSQPTWFPVKSGIGKLACKNAKGELQLSVAFEAHQLMDIKRGSKLKLTYERITVGLAWQMNPGQKMDLDSACIAVDKKGNVVMEETVYYGNLANKSMSLIHSGDEMTGETEGDDETIMVELDRVPKKILALYFLLTVAGPPNKTLKDVNWARARFVDTETKQGLCRFVPSDMGAHTSLFLGRIARDSTGWVLTPIAEGDDHARDFGSLIPQIKGYTRDLVPDIRIDPMERVAVMRKGTTIRVTDYVPGEKLPKWLSFGVAWSITEGANIDLDASAIMLDKNLELVDTVYYKQLKSKDKAVRHSGDERKGDQAGDDEKIHVNLAEVSDNIYYIGFVVNSYSGQELDDVEKASCHLFHPKTHQDVAKYTLSNAKDLDKRTALVMGCVYRVGPEWHFRVISEATDGRRVADNVDELQNFLRRNPPQSPNAPPPPDPDTELHEMPDAVRVEQEVVVVPNKELPKYFSQAI